MRRETSSPPDSCDYTSYYHQPRVPGPVATDPCAKRLQGLGLIQSVHSMARRLINTTINYHSAFSPLLPPFLRTRQVATTLNLAGLVSVLITTSIASKSRLPRHLYIPTSVGARIGGIFVIDKAFQVEVLKFLIILLIPFFSTILISFISLLTRANTGNSSRYDCDWGGTIGETRA